MQWQLLNLYKLVMLNFAFFAWNSFLFKYIPGIFLADNQVVPFSGKIAF